MSSVEFDVLSMRAWGSALEAGLPRDRTANLVERKRQVAALADTFQNIVIALSPPLCVEIGAHEASFSMAVKDACPKTEVVAFEANKDVHVQHAGTLAARGVDYRHACVSDRTGEAHFMVPVARNRSVTKMGSLLREESGRESVAQTVPAITFDDWIGDRAGPMVVWIDVEGAITQVLASAGVALSRCVCLFVELETVARWDGQGLDKHVIATLAAHGLRPVLRDAQRDWQYNALFLHEEMLSNGEVLRLVDHYCKSAFDSPAPAEHAMVPATAVLPTDVPKRLRQIGKLVRKLENELSGGNEQ